MQPGWLSFFPLGFPAKWRLFHGPRAPAPSDGLCQSRGPAGALRAFPALQETREEEVTSRVRLDTNSKSGRAVLTHDRQLGLWGSLATGEWDSIGLAIHLHSRTFHASAYNEALL